ncbi:MAG: hypothetical protein ACI87O_002702 [Planctomycetota bacterium]|jgi:hypothetical protein
MYERDGAGGWNFQYKFVRPDGVMWDMLGISVSIGDNYLLVGDRGGVVAPAAVPGSAFVFELPMGHESCPGVANSTGQSAEVEVLGTDAAATNWVTLRARGLPSGVFGDLLGSQSQSFLPGVGRSQGNLCLAGVLYRFNRPGSVGSGECRWAKRDAPRYRGPLKRLNPFDPSGSRLDLSILVSGPQSNAYDELLSRNKCDVPLGLNRPCGSESTARVPRPENFNRLSVLPVRRTTLA